MQVCTKICLWTEAITAFPKSTCNLPLNIHKLHQYGKPNCPKEKKSPSLGSFFSFARGLLSILLSIEAWNDLLIHVFPRNFYIITKPIFSPIQCLSCIYPYFLARGSTASAQTEGLGLVMAIFELERFKSRDAVNKKFHDITVCSGTITMSP